MQVLCGQEYLNNIGQLIQLPWFKTIIAIQRDYSPYLPMISSSATHEPPSTTRRVILWGLGSKHSERACGLDVPPEFLGMTCGRTKQNGIPTWLRLSIVEKRKCAMLNETGRCTNPSLSAKPSCSAGAASTVRTARNAHLLIVRHRAGCIQLRPETLFYHAAFVLECKYLDFANCFSPNRKLTTCILHVTYKLLLGSKYLPPNCPQVSFEAAGLFGCAPIQKHH